MSNESTPRPLASRGLLALNLCGILGAVLGWVARDGDQYGWGVFAFFAAAGIVAWAILTAAAGLAAAREPAPPLSHR